MIETVPKLVYHFRAPPLVQGLGSGATVGYPKS
jgi:hypothetical protein